MLRGQERQEIIDQLGGEKCQSCGTIRDSLILVHLDENRDNDELSNLRLLCLNCAIKRHHRKYIINTSNGRLVVPEKRRFPSNGACELCGRKKKRLNYHHWDDNCPAKGLWLCSWCHQAAEVLDSGLDRRYFALKKSVEESLCIG